MWLYAHASDSELLLFSLHRLYAPVDNGSNKMLQWIPFRRLLIYLVQQFIACVQNL